MQNLYKPDLMEVIGVRQHTSDVKSISLRFQDPERARQFTFQVGQFGIFSAFGAGESTFNI
jgi:NAD(P)H-flavin reductase